MEKIKVLIPVLLLISSVFRTFIYGATIPDALIVLFLCALAFAICFYEQSAAFSDIEKKFAELEVKSAAQDKELREFREYIGSQRMAQTLGRSR